MLQQLFESSLSSNVLLHCLRLLQRCLQVLYRPRVYGFSFQMTKLRGFWSAHAQSGAFYEEYDDITLHVRYDESPATASTTRHALATVLMYRRSPVFNCHCYFIIFFTYMPYSVILLPFYLPIVVKIVFFYSSVVCCVTFVRGWNDLLCPIFLRDT